MLNVPALHRRHPVAPDATVAAVPGPHAAHTVAPNADAYSPCPHAAHTVPRLCPAAPLNVPAAHSSTVLPPSQYAPAGHTKHPPEMHVVAPADGCVCSGHGRHASLHPPPTGQYIDDELHGTQRPVEFW